jgi:hypothetical protein
MSIPVWIREAVIRATVEAIVAGHLEREHAAILDYVNLAMSKQGCVVRQGWNNDDLDRTLTGYLIGLADAQLDRRRKREARS